MAKIYYITLVGPSNRIITESAYTKKEKRDSDFIKDLKEFKDGTTKEQRKGLKLWTYEIETVDFKELNLSKEDVN